MSEFKPSSISFIGIFHGFSCQKGPRVWDFSDFIRISWKVEVLKWLSLLWDYVQLSKIFILQAATFLHFQSQLFRFTLVLTWKSSLTPTIAVCHPLFHKSIQSLFLSSFPVLYIWSGSDYFMSMCTSVCPWTYMRVCKYVWVNVCMHVSVQECVYVWGC